MPWEYIADAGTRNEANKVGRKLLKEGFTDYKIHKDYGWYMIEGFKE
jgi:hypothetical protein